ncbi:MAG: MliC family protein [Pseudomonadales bacterium]|nr:MliC family protein [Pseudomonadales bacterium]
MKWKLCALLLVASLPALGGGEGAEPAATANPHAGQRLLPRTLVYDCSGFEFVTRVGPGEMALWLPGRYLVLSQVRSASGSKYQEGDIVFWSKGDNAMLQLADVEYPQCRLQPERAPWADARRRGVDFRAVGNEPGWHLEIQQGRQLLFVGNYGEQRLSTPDPGVQVAGQHRSYRASTEAVELAVDILATPCFDSMSGEAFPAAVTVTVNGRELQGCGRDLERLSN